MKELAQLQEMEPLRVSNAAYSQYSFSMLNSPGMISHSLLST